MSTCSVGVTGDSRSNGYVCTVVAWFMELVTTTFRNCMKVEHVVLINEIKVT